MAHFSPALRFARVPHPEWYVLVKPGGGGSVTVRTATLDCRASVSQALCQRLCSGYLSHSLQQLWEVREPQLREVKQQGLTVCVYERWVRTQAAQLQSELLITLLHSLVFTAGG